VFNCWYLFISVVRRQLGVSYSCRYQMAARCWTITRIVPTPPAFGVGFVRFRIAFHLKGRWANHYGKSEGRNGVRVWVWAAKNCCSVLKYSKSVVWSCDAAQNDGQDYGNEGTFSTRAGWMFVVVTGTKAVHDSYYSPEKFENWNKMLLIVM
jgi:hypothetical protein